MCVHLERACITLSSYEKLLGITIDSDLKFDKHVSDLCDKISKKKQQKHHGQLQIMCL